MPTLEPESISLPRLELLEAQNPENSAAGADSSRLSGLTTFTKASQVDAVTLLLSRGCVALIDAEDECRVRAVGKWTASWRTHGWYAVNHKGGVSTYLHRFVMDAAKGVQVDHKSTDGLDCRKDNLRVATQTQNNANRRKGAAKHSTFKGVDLHAGKWRARVKRDKKQVSLGHFVSEEDAARAYDAAAALVHGDFARLNFPASTEPA